MPLARLRTELTGTGGLSRRAVAREADVSLSTVQRVLDGHAPTLSVITRVGLAVGLRLVGVPLAPDTGTARTTAPPFPADRPSGPTWTGGRWLDDDANYLTALLGAELRHRRRHTRLGRTTIENRAAELKVQPVTLRRLEVGGHNSFFVVAEAALLACGLTLVWEPVGAPWRLRPWQVRQPGTQLDAMRAARRAHGHRAATRTALEDTWTTPPDLIESIVDEFGAITLDAAAREGDQVVTSWLGVGHPSPPRQDALVYADWADLAQHPIHEAHVFLNPPFGRQSAAFVQRAIATSKNGVPVTCILPARVDTKLWQDAIFPYSSSVRFLRGRVKYGRSGSKLYDAPSPFPSALIRFEARKRS